MSERRALGLPLRLLLTITPNLALVVAACYLPADGIARGPALFSIIGNFHIIALHLPVALLIIIPLFELLDWNQHAQTGTRRLSMLAAISTWAAAILGIIYAHYNGFDGDDVQLHLWTGIAASCLASTSWLLLHQGRTTRLTFQFLSIFAMFYAAHIGGEMVHGEDFPLKANKVSKELP